MRAEALTKRLLLRPVQHHRKPLGRASSARLEKAAGHALSTGLRSIPS